MRNFRGEGNSTLFKPVWFMGVTKNEARLPYIPPFLLRSMRFFIEITPTTHAMAFDSDRIVGNWSSESYLMAVIIIMVNFFWGFMRMIPTITCIVIFSILSFNNMTTTIEKYEKYYA
jgi:hypothetical protein